MTPSLPPVHASIRVSWTPTESFRRFTTDIGRWWPTASHSVGGKRTTGVSLQPRVGGEIVESIHGGREAHWGTITDWDPPGRVAFTWHPGRSPDTGTRVEVRFLPDGTGTRVELVHSGWEALGALAKTARNGYPIGWAYVLRLYANRRWSPVVLGIGTLQWLLQPLAARMAAKAGPMVTRPSATP